jgi:cystathionine gamma-synthase
MEFETRALHGRRPSALLDGAVTDPIYLSTTFPREGDGSYPHGYSYARNANPNRDALEETLATLEGGAACATFASGTAATMAVYQSLATGDHVLAPRDGYYGTRVMLRDVFPRWGLTHELLDMTSLDAIERAITPKTRVIWVETPSNPMMRVVDVKAVAALARQARALLVVDNTVPTPLLQRPFELGADLVVHSTTKYLNGHSDVLGGAVVARDGGETFDRIRTIQIHGGAIPSPFDCWLTLRGVRTLAHRVRAQSVTALAVAQALTRMPAVERVHYAGLPSHPQHALAAQQMRGGFGGLLSFEVKGGERAAFAAAAKLRLIHRATSLGGVETLIEHRKSVEGPGSTVPDGLLRLSVGLEAAADLIADLTQALG